MASQLIKKELFPGIPIEEVVSDYDCVANMSALCNIRQYLFYIYYLSI